MMKSSISIVSCWLFLMGYSWMGQAPVVALPHGRAWVADLQTQRGHVETIYQFDVPDGKARRLQIQLRIPFSNARLILKDPAGKVVAPSVDSEVQIQPRDQIHHPERGDRYQLPEQRNPVPGRWSLFVLHPEASGSEIIGVTVTLLDRFALHLSSSTLHSQPGEPILITVLPTDYGAAMRMEAIPVRVIRHADGSIRQILAEDDAVSPQGIRLSTEHGRYFAVFRPDAPGTYSFSAELQLQDERIGSNRVTVRVSRTHRSHAGEAR